MEARNLVGWIGTSYAGSECVQGASSLFTQKQFADLVVWIQGEADALRATAPEKYANDETEGIDYVEAQKNPTPRPNNLHTI